MEYTMKSFCQEVLLQWEHQEVEACDSEYHMKETSDLSHLLNEDDTIFRFELDELKRPCIYVKSMSVCRDTFGNMHSLERLHLTGVFLGFSMSVLIEENGFTLNDRFEIVKKGS